VAIESDDEVAEDELAALAAGALDHPDDDDVQTLVIIGNGMTSYRLCQKLVEHGVQMHSRIVVFGEERFPAYDRVHLTDIFAGRAPEALILAEEDWYEANGIELYLGNPVVDIDREQSFVVAATGDLVPYNRLVFATGSEPFVPPIEGLRVADELGNLKLQKHVFLYRTFDDVYTIEAELEQTSRAVIMGGGLLGLEAAKAVFDLGRRMHEDIQVEVVEAAPRLMPRQLDDGAAGLLKEKIEQLGVHVHVGKKISRVAYDEETDRVSVHFDDDRAVRPEDKVLEANMLIVSAGIRPRSELAKKAGLVCAPNGGIVVNDQLRTSDEQIYAIGECASHNGTTYGLVAPGYQMVDVLVANLMGENARFTGADQSAKLKLLGVTVAALGEYDGDTKPLSSALRYTTGGVYRKLVTRQGRLIGAVTIGDWDNLDRIREALLSPAPMSFWDMRRFRSSGNLFPREESKKVTEWSDDAIVCGCVRVTRGQLSMAIAAGATNVNDLSKRTGAGTVCGSCKSLLAELIGEDELETMTIALPDAASAYRDRPSVSARGPNLLRLDRPAPMSKRPGSTAPVSVRRPGSPALPVITGFQSIVMPGQMATGPYRAKLVPEVIAPAVIATDEDIDNLYSSKRNQEAEEPEQNLQVSRRPGTRKRREGQLRNPSAPAVSSSPAASSVPASSAPDTLEAIRRSLPPMSHQEEVEVGLSSDRAPALLEEGGVLSGDFRVPSFPMPPSFESNVFSANEAFEDDEEEEYDTEMAEAINEMDGPYPTPQQQQRLVHARRSWVPAQPRRSMRPGANAAAAEAELSAPAAVHKEPSEPEPGYRPLATASIAAIVLAIIAAVSRPIPIPSTATFRFSVGRLLADNPFQQATGYLLVLLSVFSLVLSLRKRWARFQLFDFPFFRVIHVILGTSTLVVLAMHTGLRLGRGFQFALAVDFLAVCILGGIAGIVTAVSHRWDGITARDRRLASTRVHLVAFWPLPVLIALHIYQIYYY
jgi:nitrite reductase (NADH) large subunit